MEYYSEINKSKISHTGNNAMNVKDVMLKPITIKPSSAEFYLYEIVEIMESSSQVARES